MIARAGAAAVALACALVLLSPGALAADKFIQITNNAGSDFTSILVSFRVTNGAPVAVRDRRRIARHAVIKYTLPQTVTQSGAKIDVSSTCKIDLEFFLADGTSYWMRDRDLCYSPYIDARDSSAYAYSSYAYATPIPYTPEPTATPAPTPSPQTPAEQEVTRGAELFARGNFDDSLLFFNRAVKLDPNDAFALAYRCRTYFLQDHFDRALTDCDKGLQLVPSSGLLFWLRGLTLWSMGVYGSAASDFHSAGQHEAPLTWLTILQALAQRDDGHAGEAKAALVECKKSCKPNKMVALELRYLLGEVTAPALLQAAKTVDDRSDVHAILGITLQQHGNAKDAKAHFAWVLNNGAPTENWKPIIRQRMKGLK